ncbi:MAG TPA: hypothetical protein VJM14_00945 [Burkholderiales bacterium]|nr:hypothetical protein [Burkholderiales bacterium]
MRDYWLNKLFYDLTRSSLGAAYKAEREPVLDRYPLKPEVRRALVEDDLDFIARAGLANPYLLRYYFQLLGYDDEAVMAKLHAAAAPPEGV